MKRKNIYIVLLIVSFGCSSTGCFGQGVWDAWDRSASNVDHNRTKNTVINARNQAEKSSSRDRGAERQNQLRNDLRQASDVISHLDNSEYRSIILHESEFREKLKTDLLKSNIIAKYYSNNDVRQIILSDNNLRKKLIEEIWENRNRILKYSSNSDLKEFILSDSRLREYYETEVKKQDMRSHPEKTLEYIKDPQVKEIIKADTELSQLLAQQIKEQVEKEQIAIQRRLNRQKAEEERAERDRQAEIKRRRDEEDRAKAQEKQNKQKRESKKQLSNKLQSELSPKTNIATESNQAPQSKVPQNSINDFFGDPALFHLKLNSAVYNTETELQKALRNAPTLSEYISGETEKIQNKAKGKLISIPIGKVNEMVDIVLNTGWPGANLGEKARVSNLVREEEGNFVSEALKCVVKSVSSEDMNKFNECVQRAKDSFVDQLKSNIDELTHVKVFGTIRKYKKWLTKTNPDDEEY